MDNSDTRQFLSPEAVSELLAVPVDSVYDLIESGELLAIRVGAHGPWRIEGHHLEAFIADGYEQQRFRQKWNQASLANVYDLSDGRLI